MKLSTIISELLVFITKFCKRYNEWPSAKCGKIKKNDVRLSAVSFKLIFGVSIILVKWKKPVPV